MYSLPLIIVILQIARCLGDDETQILVKGTPKKTHWICERDDANFTEFLQETHFYVDKSLLLGKIFANENSTNVFISIPPKWGKSLSLKMIEFFFDFKVAADHSVIPAKETASYKFFAEGKIPSTETAFPKPPLISKNTDFIASHLAQYHVVYLDFEQFTSAKNFPKFYSDFKDAISKLFESRLYVKDVMVKNLTDQLSKAQNEIETNLTKGLMNTLQNQFDCYVKKAEADEDEWADCLAYLSKLIGQFFGKKVIFLLDNHDSIVSMMARMSKLGRARAYTFLQNFFKKTLNESPTLYKCIAVATLPLVLDKIANNTGKEFAYLGNIKNQLFPFYGFTKNEFYTLSEQLKLTNNQSDQAIERFDGYFDGTILNPLSVTKFLNTLEISNYWAQERSVHVNELDVLPETHFHDFLKKLVGGERFPFHSIRKLPIPFSYTDKATSVSPLWVGEDAAEASISAANTENDEDFLLYLMAKGIVSSSHENNKFSVGIANEENKAVIRRRFPEL